MINIRTKKKVVNSLKKHARSMDDWVRPTTKTSKLRAADANSFLLGVMFDRSIPYEKAWQAGEWITEALGEPDNAKSVWKNLGSIPKANLIGFLRYGYGGKALHRHYKTFPKQLPKAAKITLEKYKGDPRNIWNSQRDVAEVRNRLVELPGIGPALSRMAVLILARTNGLLGGKAALPQLDIKSDMHVMRVFKRTGLIQQNSKESDAIEAARQLNKKFPAELDAPSWVIGQTWCRPKNSNCIECPISEQCPKIGLPK